MHISIVTVFPDLYEQFLKTSLLKKAQEQSHLAFEVAGFSSFCAPKERLDGPVVGHGDGMVIRPEVIERAVTSLETKRGCALRIFMTPQGKKLTQDVARELMQKGQQYGHVMFVAGRYEGFDERAQKEYADVELSIGDYVLMGGDLPVMVALETKIGRA